VHNLVHSLWKTCRQPEEMPAELGLCDPQPVDKNLHRAAHRATGYYRAGTDSPAQPITAR